VGLRSHVVKSVRTGGGREVLLIVAACALGGCSPTQQRNGDSIEVSAGGAAATVQVVTLADGTRCATLIGSYKAAISCDWEHAGPR